LENRKDHKVYDNAWITLTHEDVIIPSGNDGIYGKVHFKNYAVGIIPLDQDGNTLGCRSISIYFRCIQLGNS
jgi:ADP-ribose pyrophosphatase